MRLGRSRYRRAWYELQQVAWAYARRIGNVGRGIRLANTVLI